jgi:dTDP-4-amino-4,6-dideoxygalactose transaminase
MPVPLLDLQAQLRELEVEISAALAQVIQQSAFVLGPAVETFEKEFARFCKTKHCVAVNSGTSALHLALVCLNVGRDDEVITVPMTFAATLWGISYVGAKPVFVDIDPVRRTLDPGRLRETITERTKAIIPVHLYGMPADMEGIVRIADQFGIPVIEDACQAHGALYHEQPVGSIGRIGCFSFYPSKNLGAYGEGGALVTDDDEIADRARRLRDQGQSQRYFHNEVGYNYRMDGFQGAVLGVKLRHLETWNTARARVAKRYRDLLTGLPITLPAEPPDSQSAWHLYVVEVLERDSVRSKLAESGIQTGLHYPLPVHLQKAFAGLGLTKGMLPISEKLAEQCLSLPIYPELTGLQVVEVAESLHRTLKLASTRS